jgi:hypothetical protein
MDYRLMGAKLGVAVGMMQRVAENFFGVTSVICHKNVS